jgi:hypothetical protein
MGTRSPWVLRSVLLGAVLLAVASGGCQRGGNAQPAVLRGADFVLLPDEVHYGATYAQWSQRWWQWAYELPRTGHPLYDPTGANALQGQIDPVWFIGGAFAAFGDPPPGAVVRDITIPGGIALFFPIINAVSDNTNCGLPDTTFSFTELRALCAQTVESVRDVYFEIDGEVVIDSTDLGGAERFRAQAPAFGAWLTDDNIWSDFCGGVPQPARVVETVAADGIYAMVGPMPSGAHTLRFAGTFSSTGYRVDVTYHVNVLP